MQAVRWTGFWASSVAIVLFVTTLTALPLFGAGAVPSGPNPPLGVHLSYLDDPTTASITWLTTGAATSRAEWGRSPGPPYTFHAAGADYSSPGGTHLHVVNLTGLTPGATYYYRVGDGGMASTFGQASFRAAPPKGASDTFTFAAAGDWGNSTQTASTSNSIAKRDPNFVLALGDLYYSHDEASVASVYQKWMTFAQDSFLQAGVGNHEVDEQNDSNTPTRVACAFSNLPGNERTYAFTWGNTFFVTMDWGGSTTSRFDGVDGTVQDCNGVVGTTAIRTWVDAQLTAANANPTIRWIIAYEHFPCYDMTLKDPPFPLLCSTDGGNDQIEDILTNHHVDLVLSGHDHTYSRTDPVYYKHVNQTGNAFENPGAPMYLTLGTGGASGKAPCRSDAWIAFCQSNTTRQGFGSFQVSPTMIKYEFVENTAGVIDSFTLEKSPSAGFAVSADPSAIDVQPGSAASTNVSVLGASADPVALTISGCPLGATCSVSPDSGSPPFTSTLTVSTTSFTREGNFRITAIASNATASARAPVDLTVATRITRSYQKGDLGSYSETDDAYIYNGSMNQNFGSEPNLFITSDRCVQSSSHYACKSLLKFPQLVGPNDGQVPRGSKVISASLQLWVTNNGTTEDIYQVIEPWNESTVTWNSLATPGFPKVADPVFNFAPHVPVPGFFSLDVKFLVQKWADGDPNQGFLLTSASGDRVFYDSSESTTPAHRPKLTLTYEAPVALFRDLRLWPFSADSVWNLPIGASAVYVPAGIAQATARGMTTDPDVLILDPGAPITPVYYNNDGWTGRSRCDAQGGVLFEAPIPAGFVVAGAAPGSTPNHAVAILDADGETLFQGQPYTHCTADGPVTMWWFQSTEDLDGSGVDGGHGGSKLSSIGGTIRLGELVPGGVIRHAMKVSLDGLANLYFNTSTGGFRWPASVADVCASTCYGGTNPALRMGALLALPASLDIDLLGLETEPAKILARGLQDYGAYVVDNAGWSVYGLDVESSPSGNVEDEFATSWGFSMAQDSKDVPWARDMDRIFGALNVVDNWDLSKWQTVSASGGTLGAGLGAPRSAWAPALGETPSPVPFDFSLSTSSSSGFLAVHGQSVSMTVAAQRTFGPTHGVQYSCANLPSGATCTFTPPTCSPTCTANLVLATSSSTPAGTYSISIQAGDGTITRSSGFTLTVGDPLLAYDMETLTGTGLMKDLSGHGNDGTIAGATDIPGEAGRARHFNVGDRITAPAISVPATDFTVAAWFRWTTNPTPYYSGIQGGGFSWELRVRNDGRFAVVFYQAIGPDVVTEVVSPLAYNDGEWHHAAAVLRSGLAELYVDGVLVAQDTTNPIASVRTSSQTILGKVASDFAGDIDEIFVFSRALSVAEIAILAPPPPVDGPILRYDMETLTATGRMKDLSGHVNHGEIAGTLDVAGKVSRARNFDGSEDRITAPAISVPATNFTIAAWFRWTTNPTPYYSGIQGGGFSWELRILNDGRFAVVFYQAVGPDAVTEAASRLAYNDGEWHHVAGVLRNGLAELYVDGALIAYDATGPISSVRPSTGVQLGLIASDFVGDIDEVLVYDRALSSGEIVAIAPPPPVDGPILRYDMETLTATGRMKDLSGHVNHGTITDATAVPGEVGGAMHFDGSGDRITAPAISVPATDFTVAAWFRWTTNPTPYYSGIQGGGFSWELRVRNDGRFAVVFYQAIGPDVVTEVVSPLAYNDGEWHHAAAVLRSGLAELYVDGVLVAQDSTSAITSVRSSTLTEIGHVASDFAGDIDEVFVSFRALTAGEIAALASG